MGYPIQRLTPEVLELLLAIYNETRPGGRPYSTDSYLPPHLVERLESLMLGLSNGVGTPGSTGGVGTPGSTGGVGTPGSTGGAGTPS